MLIENFFLQNYEISQINCSIPDYITEQEKEAVLGMFLFIIQFYTYLFFTIQLNTYISKT